MVKMKYCCLTLVLLLVVPLISPGQVLRLIPYNGTSASLLEQQIIVDSTANNGIPAGRIYELQRGKVYCTQAQFNLRKGLRLYIRANDSTGSRPVVMLYPSATTGNPTLPWNLTGGDLILKNVIVSGYFEPVDSNYRNIQGNIIRTQTVAGGSITIDSCIIKSANGQFIRTEAGTHNVVVTNSIFADMGFVRRSDLGAGKFIDLRETACDSLVIVNNTFVNFQDRIIRHYNLSGAGATSPIKYLAFEHNTVVNGMSFHGLLSLGSLGYKAVVANNLFLDPFVLGEDTTNTVRALEFGRTLETYPGGTNRIVWAFSAPNDTTQWYVKYNYYAISDSGQAFLNEEKAYLRDSVNVKGVEKLLGVGSPLSYHIYGKVDSATAFIKLPSLTLGNIPQLSKMLRLCRWYLYPPANRTKLNSSTLFKDTLHHYDRRSYQYYDDTLDCTYSTSSPAYTGARLGYPAGDLNWYPAKLAQWLSDPRVTNVQEPEAQSVPTGFSLGQNYPNPFNPSTTLEFSIPKSSHVVLEVFNVLGQSVARLVDGAMSAGTYRTAFDASNLSSGVYLYRLKAGEFVQARKMVVMK